MPIHECTENGKAGFKWGEHGKCFPTRAEAEKQAAAAYANGYAGDCYALDKAANRTKTIDGFLSVGVSNFTKAMVCPYYGKEIPGAVELGLDDNRIYYLLRCPEELKKGIHTFNGVPLLTKHVPVNTVKFSKELVAGAMGNDAVFEYPYGKNSLTIWHAEDIEGVENRDKTELSAAYRYIADMTPGEFEGQKYDGVMRNIVGNHVALVDRGRAGHDVIVGDSHINFYEGLTMPATAKAKQIEELLAADADLTLEKRQSIAAFLAKDEKLWEKVKGSDDDDDDDEDNEEDKAKKKKKAKADEDKLKPKIKGSDDDDDEDDKVSKKAMDIAIAKVAEETEKTTTAKITALFAAKQEVSGIVGDVALDSAEAVYKFALDHLKVDVDGIHPSAYRSLVKAHAPGKVQQIAQDKKTTGKDLNELFPGTFDHIRKGY
jgi:hypothetical protein